MVRRGLTFPASETDRETYQAGPVSFLRQVLGVDPWERQVQIVQAVADHSRVTVRSCHHSGKTWTAATLVHWFLRAFDPSLVLTTAPTDRQVRELLWYEIAEQQRRGKLAGRMTETSIEVSPTQRAFGFSTNTPERFQGWHAANVLIVVDEASGVPETIYEAIEGCLTGPNAHLLLIGNPNNPSGTFYESFRSPLYEKFHISAFNVPEHLLPAAWAEERRREWGEESPAYQVRVLGNFPEQGEDSLISLRWVTEAQERESLEVTGAGVPSIVEMGVDIARYGGDESVAYVRCGPSAHRVEGWRGNDTMQSTGRIVALAKECGVTLIKVDEIGVGAGVLDRLRELPELKAARCTVTGINVGESASDSEHFANRRSEIFWGLRERFKSGDISIRKGDTLLLDQLVALKFSYTSRGQIKLMSKEDMRKERSSSSQWQSPDRADALALAYCKPTGFRAVALVGAPRRAR